jgi:hypothetical protein
LQYVDDVEEMPEGLRVTIRRSKTDQESCSHAAMRGLDLAQRAIAVAAERAVSQRVSVARHEAMKYRRDIRWIKSGGDRRQALSFFTRLRIYRCVAANRRSGATSR